MTVTYEEAWTAQREEAHRGNITFIKWATREINKAVAERNYSRVAVLANQLNQYALARSWDA